MNGSSKRKPLAFGIIVAVAVLGAATVRAGGGPPPAWPQPILVEDMQNDLGGSRIHYPFNVQPDAAYYPARTPVSRWMYVPRQVIIQPQQVYHTRMVYNPVGPTAAEAGAYPQPPAAPMLGAGGYYGGGSELMLGDGYQPQTSAEVNNW
ncbi:MAG: hypothetical protein HQL82_02340 [Magnetococcales bacterium]|nr:hypothetical protein [Magnetococcales bacterium]